MTVTNQSQQSRANKDMFHLTVGASGNRLCLVHKTWLSMVPRVVYCEARILGLLQGNPLSVQRHPCFNIILMSATKAILLTAHEKQNTNPSECVIPAATSKLRSTVTSAFLVHFVPVIIRYCTAYLIYFIF